MAVKLASDRKKKVEELQVTNPDFVDFRELAIPAPVVLSGLVNFAVSTLYVPNSNEIGASSFLSVKIAKDYLSEKLHRGCGFISKVREKGILVEEGIQLKVTFTADGIVLLDQYNNLYGSNAGPSVFQRLVNGDICGKKPYPRI